MDTDAIKKFQEAMHAEMYAPVTGSPESERDTHFAGFARRVWEEMLSQTVWQGIDVTAGHIPLHHPEDEEHQRYIQIIARAAYDLTCHAIRVLDSKHLLHFDEYRDADAIVDSDIPDLTERPSE